MNGYSVFGNLSWFEHFAMFYLQGHFDSAMIASYFDGVAVLSSDHCVTLSFVWIYYFRNVQIFLRNHVVVAPSFYQQSEITKYHYIYMYGKYKNGNVYEYIKMAMCLNLNNAFVVHFHIISSKKMTRGENNWTILNRNTNICNIPNTSST